MKARIYSSQNDYQSAIRHFSKAIELSPDNELFYYSRAYRYYKIGNFEQALEDLERSVSIYDNYWENYFLYNAIYRELEDYDRAVDFAKRGLKFREDDYFHNRLGWTYIEAQMPIEAEAAFLAALGVDSSNSDSHSGLAKAYYEQGKYKLAIESLEKSKSLGDDSSYNYFLGGMIYDEVGEFDKAITEYQVVLERDPDYSWARNNLGWTYLKDSQLEKAISLFKQAIESGRESLHLFNNLGLAYYLIGDYEKSIASLTRAVELDDENPAISQAYIGRNLVALGRLEQAFEYLKLAVDSEPNYYDAYYIYRHERGNSLTVILNELYEKAILAEQKILVEKVEDLLEVGEKAAQEMALKAKGGSNNNQFNSLGFEYFHQVKKHLLNNPDFNLSVSDGWLIAVKKWQGAYAESQIVNKSTKEVWMLAEKDNAFLHSVAQIKQQVQGDGNIEVKYLCRQTITACQQFISSIKKVHTRVLNLAQPVSEN
nr:tetratricopeptide repeat protein [Aliikangiella sp. G2MR2-5]